MCALSEGKHRNASQFGSVTNYSPINSVQTIVSSTVSIKEEKAAQLGAIL